MQAKLGPFARWKAGYAMTLSSRPRDFVTARLGATTTVTHVLVARDEGCAAEREFMVTWRLKADSGRWIVSALSAVALGSLKC